MPVNRDAKRAAAITVAGSIAVLAACASHPDPIIDERGVDMVKYQQDLAECRGYAEKVSVTEGTAKGAAVGAIVGAAAGAISGDAAKGAGYGGLSGGTQSGLGNKREQERIVQRCISKRGYTVLN